MSVGIADAARSLEASCDAIVALATGLTQAEASWKSSPDRWSAVEVINHLADEESEDFRPRLNILIHHPEAPFVPIDPPAWVLQRRYAERDMGESVARFRSARAASIAWLEELRGEDLDRVRIIPSLGEVTGRMILASWVAHDLLHLRQLARNRYDCLADQVRPLSLAYAGELK